MSPEEIAQKYVYEMHNPMTSRVKVVEMVKDIKECMENEMHKHVEEQKTITMYRSAKSGRIVTREYAEMHPDTTVKETRKIASHLEESE